MQDDKLNAGVVDAGDETMSEAKVIPENQEAPKAEKDTAPADEPKADEANDAGADDAGEPKKKSGSARAREKIASLQAEIADLTARLAAKSDDKGPPKLDDFPDWEAHQAALNKYNLRQALDETRKEESESRLREAQQQQFEILKADHDRRETQARERIPDYDKVLNSYNGPVARPELQQLVIESGKSELLLYKFATDPNLVSELNRMTPLQLAKEVGRIEARLSYPQPKQTTNAPPPVGGVKGGASPAFDAQTASHEDFKKMFARG